jgi:sugar lactone lactonase YvrE
VTDPLDDGLPVSSDGDAPSGPDFEEAGPDANDELLTVERAGEARRAAQRQEGSAVRRARIAGIALWAGVVLLVVCGVVAVVAGLGGTGTVTSLPVPLPPTGSVAELPVINAALPSADTTPGGATGVAVSGDRVYVAESRKGFVRVTTRDGSAVATIGAGWLRTPVYVAVGPVDGRLYVSDRGRREVEVFSATGERLGVVTPQGPSGEATEGAWLPLALGFAPDGVLYVADSAEPQRVDVFSATGSRIASLGADVPDGRTGGKFAFPNGIAASTDEVLVADSNNGRLLVFDRSGAFVRQVMIDGIPRGVVVLGDGRIVLVDAAGGSVEVLDAQGQMLGAVTGQAADGASLVAPAGVALSEDGTLYVVDSATGRVFTASTPEVVGGRAGLSAETRTWLLVAAGLLWALAVFLGWRAAARARARARASGVRL